MVNQSTHFPADKSAGRVFSSTEAATVTRVLCVRVCACVLVKGSVEDVHLRVLSEGVKDGVGKEMKRDRKRKQASIISYEAERKYIFTS